MIKRIVFVFALMAGSVLAQGEFRVFKVGDRSIEARVMKVDTKRGEVELELRNKKRKKVKSAIFSKDDQNYILDYAKVLAFKSQRFKIELEKKVLDSNKEEIDGIIRETESICYSININNATDIPINGVTVAYNIFYEQEELGRGKNDDVTGVVDGTLDIKSLDPRQKVDVQTKKYEIYDQQLAGGYDGYSSGAPTRQSGKSKGVWLKLHIKTSSGLSATREVCLPKNTSKQFDWKTPQQ